MKIKITVERIADDKKSGFTTNTLHVYDNINKVPGLWNLIQPQIEGHEPDTEIEITMPYFHFITFFRFDTTTNGAKMLLFDAENDLDKALDFYNVLKDRKETEVSVEEIVDRFRIIEKFYDEVAGKAELALATLADN